MGIKPMTCRLTVYRTTNCANSAKKSSALDT
jgi:hypothetical protein